MLIEVKNAKKQYGTGEAAVFALDGALDTKSSRSVLKFIEKINRTHVGRNHHQTLRADAGGAENREHVQLRL